MNIIDKLTLRWSAARDADAGLDLQKQRATAALGPIPDFKPETRLEDRELLQTSTGQRIADLREELERAEDEAHGASPFWHRVAGVAVLGVEFAGASKLAEMVGYEGFDRLIFGAATLLFLVVLTAVAIHGPGSDTTPPKAALPFATRAKALALKLGAQLLFIVVVLAIVAVRLLDMADDDAPLIDLIPSAILVTAACIGPALILEKLWRAHAPLAEQTRVLADLRRRIAVEQQAVERASAQIRARERAATRWRQNAERLNAEYGVAHARATAKRDNKNKP